MTAFPQTHEQSRRRGVSNAPHAGGAIRTTTSSRDPSGRIYTPPGWPAEVRAPGAPDWEPSASTWLFDWCPADYRGYPVLRKHPAVLARFAAHFIEGQIQASYRMLATTRSDLSDQVDATVLDEAIAAAESEQAKLIRARRAVALIEEALAGRIFVRKL